MSKLYARVAPDEARVVERYAFECQIGERLDTQSVGSGSEVRVAFSLDGAHNDDLRALGAYVGRGLDAADDETTLAANANASASEHGLVVGFLAYDCETSPTSLTIPISDLVTGLRRGDRWTFTLERPLDTLAHYPIRIDARLEDSGGGAASNSSFFEAHEFGDRLALAITVTLELRAELLSSPRTMARQLAFIFSDTPRGKVLTADQLPVRLEEAVPSALCALANAGGGLLIYGVTRDGHVVGVSEDYATSLVQQIVHAALRLSPPVAMPPPLRFSVDGKLVVMAEVSPTAEQRLSSRAGFTFKGTRFEIDPNQSTPVRGASGHDGAADRIPLAPDDEEFTRKLSADEVSRFVQRGPSRNLCFQADVPGELPNIQVALANSGGGRLFFGVFDRGPGRAGDIRGFEATQTGPLLDKIRKSSHPVVAVGPPYSVEMGGRFVVVQSILQNSPDLYLHSDDRYWDFDGTSFAQISDEAAMARLRERRSVVGERLSVPTPVLKEFSLDWVDFPPDTDEFDPFTQRLRWRSIPMRPVSEKPGEYSCELRVAISRAKELLDRGQLRGTFRVEVDRLLVADSDEPLRFFDALGASAKVTPTGVTAIDTEFVLRLDELLKRRPYALVRHIAFDNLASAATRRRDIIRILNDFGIIVAHVHPLWDHECQKTSITGHRHTRDGATTVRCEIASTRSTIRRRSQHRATVDERQVEADRVEMTLTVSGEGLDLGAVRLLNDIVEALGNRLELSARD